VTLNNSTVTGNTAAIGAGVDNEDAFWRWSTAQ
jgi:hypothetical protein